MEQLNSNVLIIGRSGVGKSSLLNYMFDRNIQETGVGSPVTKKGIFPSSYEYDDALKLKIYDTWGLEPDKTEEWKKLIVDEVHKHDKMEVREWFNTIIYCISANSDRVEDFEIEIMKALVREKNQVTVAITHCNNNKDVRAENLKQRLVNTADINAEQVVFVCNVDMNLIGGRVERFGKEKIFKIIISNLWESFKTKVPYLIKKGVNSSFEDERKKLKNMISEHWPIIERDKKIREFQEQFKDEFDKFIHRLIRDTNNNYLNIANYYEKLSNKYMNFGLLNEKILNNPEWKIEIQLFERFKRDVDDNVEIVREILGHFIFILKTDLSKEVLKELFANALKYFSSTKNIKNQLEKLVDENIESSKTIIYKIIDNINGQIQSSVINKTSK